MSADADDLLRRTVSELSARKDCAWAGIYFVEDDSLVLGPEAGRPDPERRTTVSVLWRDTRIAVPDDAPRCYRQAFTGECAPVVEDGGRRWMRAADVFAHFPIAFLEVA